MEVNKSVAESTGFHFQKGKAVSSPEDLSAWCNHAYGRMTGATDPFGGAIVAKHFLRMTEFAKSFLEMVPLSK